MVNSTKVDQGVQEINGYKIVRMIRWFEKTGDALVGEAILLNTPLSTLQALFHESGDNPMFDCYPIQDSQVDYLQQQTGIPIDLRTFDYFLECDAV